MARVSRFGIFPGYQNFHNMKTSATHVCNIDELHNMISKFCENKNLPDSVYDFMEKVCHRLENEEKKADQIVGECWRKEQKKNKQRNKKLKRNA